MGSVVVDTVVIKFAVIYHPFCVTFVYITANVYDDDAVERN